MTFFMVTSLKIILLGGFFKVNGININYNILLLVYLLFYFYLALKHKTDWKSITIYSRVEAILKGAWAQG